VTMTEGKMSALEQARLEKAREIVRYSYEGCVNQHMVAFAVTAALAALTEANWQPPVDPDLLIAREAAAIAWGDGFPGEQAQLRGGLDDTRITIQSALAAIKLFKARQS
jgi:hypothetical protein